LCCILALISGSLEADVEIKAEGDGGLIDTPFNLLVSGVTPSMGVPISARLADETGRVWTSTGVYFAGSDGTVDLGRNYSIGGTYGGIDPHGLLWSMSPVPEEGKAEFLRKTATDPEFAAHPVMAPGGPMNLHITALADDGSEASTTVIRHLGQPGIRSRDVHEGRLHGQLHQPAPGYDGAIRGAVLVLTGSGGGIDTLFAPLLASRGYMVFAQAYFAFEGVQPALHDIPLELFAEGIAYLSKQAGGLPVVLMGTSRGSEAVQLAAVHFPSRVAGVIARVPSHVVNAAARSGVEFRDPTWTLNGQPLPYLEYDDGVDDLVAEYGSDPEGFQAAAGYLKIWAPLGADTEFHIPVERLPGPLLIISGSADEIWPSALAGDRLAERLTEQHFPHEVRNLRLAGAGHAIRLPNYPAPFTRGYHPLGVFLRMGGTPQANARAARVAWQETLEFLSRIYAH
jgi:pimeloyl-ACP methyl ester carboxylesterase